MNTQKKRRKLIRKKNDKQVDKDALKEKPQDYQKELRRNVWYNNIKNGTAWMI